MTRYLESWGAVKPFAHLQSPESFTSENIVTGKTRFKVSRLDCLSSFKIVSALLRKKDVVKFLYIFN